MTNSNISQREQGFLHDDFFLESETARILYYEYASHLPIIDYHNHLDPSYVANNKQFNNITEAWLAGDHYKWRAMRSNGIAEQYISGKASPKAKFMKWAETVPHTIRNPLYQWTHLELKRYFGIEELLNKDSSETIYENSTGQLQEASHSACSLLNKMQVEVICTSDDPTDSLEHHQAFAAQNSTFQMLPTFRPDSILSINDDSFILFIKELESSTGISIGSFDDLLHALDSRTDHFQAAGCCLADHGLECMPSSNAKNINVNRLFIKRLSGKYLTGDEVEQYAFSLLINLAQIYDKKGWTAQYHLGALRNTRPRILKVLGKDAGCDSIGDIQQAASLASFLGQLDNMDCLPRTILYNLNPSENAVFSTMAGNFGKEGIPGKVQWGPAWWFLDQKLGIEDQLNTLSSTGLLSRFIGMLTDSRSFLSFPRHEYFRRVLCNLLGNEMESGLLPGDISWMGDVVKNICYFNAKRYFGF